MALWAQSTSSLKWSSLRSSPCFIQCTTGVSPTLFLMFINDLQDNIKSSVRLLADDCVLYRNIHSLQDCLILQEDLDSLGLWEAEWQMKFNVVKCHSMRVTLHYSHKQIQGWSTHTRTCTRTYSSTFFSVLSSTLYLAKFMSTCTHTYLSTVTKNPVLMSTLRVLLSTFLNFNQIGKS